MRFARALLSIALTLTLLFIPGNGMDTREVKAYVGWVGADSVTIYNGSAPIQPSVINVSRSLSDSEITFDKCIALDSLGRPHIVWCETVNSSPVDTFDVFYVYWDGGNWRCADGSIYSYSSLPSNPANVSDTDLESCHAFIALDSNDNPHITWSDNTYSSYYDILSLIHI